MGFRFNGGGCCCDTCGIFTDVGGAQEGDNWDSQSGTWTAGATTSSSALIFAAVAYNDVPPTRITVGITMTTTSDKARVVVGGSDSSNYLYAELTKNASTFSLKLFKVVATVHTQLGTTQTSGTADSVSNMEVCYSNGILTAMVYWGGTFDGAKVLGYSQVVTAPGYRHGLGTGTLTGTVTFSSYVAMNAQSTDQPTCPTCRTACNTCLNNEAAQLYQGVLSGATGGAAVANGTYIFRTGTAGGAGGFGQCYAYSVAPFAIGIYSLNGFYIYFTTSGGDYEIEMGVDYTSGFSLFIAQQWSKTQTTPKVDCANLDAEVVTSDGSTAPFDFSGSQWTITAL